MPGSHHRGSDESTIGGDERVLRRVFCRLPRAQHSQTQIVKWSLIVFDEQVESVEVALPAAGDQIGFVEVCAQR
jgi:hypothetical protein